MSGNDKLEEEIFTKINKLGSVSFSELIEIDGVVGDYSYGIQGKNIFYWIGLLEQAIAAIESLIKNKKMIMKPASQLTYMIDGTGLTLPIAKSNRSYKKPRWLPVCFDAV